MGVRRARKRRRKHETTHQIEKLDLTEGIETGRTPLQQRLVVQRDPELCHQELDEQSPNQAPEAEHDGQRSAHSALQPAIGAMGDLLPSLPPACHPSIGLNSSPCHEGFRAARTDRMRTNPEVKFYSRSVPVVRT